MNQWMFFSFPLFCFFCFEFCSLAFFFFCLVWICILPKPWSVDQWMLVLSFQHSKKFVLIFFFFLCFSVFEVTLKHFYFVLQFVCQFFVIMYLFSLLHFVRLVFIWHFVLIRIWQKPWCVVFVCPGLGARCSCLDIHSHTCRGTSWFECESFVSYCVILLYNVQQLLSNEYSKTCCLTAYTMLPWKTVNAISFSNTQASL